MSNKLRFLDKAFLDKTKDLFCQNKVLSIVFTAVTVLIVIMASSLLVTSILMCKNTCKKNHVDNAGEEDANLTDAASSLKGAVFDKPKLDGCTIKDVTDPRKIQ